jgi:hypothetical protein
MKMMKSYWFCVECRGGKEQGRGASSLRPYQSGLLDEEPKGFRASRCWETLLACWAHAVWRIWDFTCFYKRDSWDCRCLQV